MREDQQWADNAQLHMRTEPEPGRQRQPGGTDPFFQRVHKKQQHGHCARNPQKVTDAVFGGYLVEEAWTRHVDCSCRPVRGAQEAQVRRRTGDRRRAGSAPLGMTELPPDRPKKQAISRISVPPGCGGTSRAAVKVGKYPTFQGYCLMFETTSRSPGIPMNVRGQGTEDKGEACCVYRCLVYLRVL